MRPELRGISALGLTCLLGLSGCWIWTGDEVAECPVKGYDVDALRMPPFVPAQVGELVGDSTADGMAVITLQAPRGHYDYSLGATIERSERCLLHPDVAECELELDFDVDLSGVLPEPDETGALGDFEAERDHIQSQYFDLACDHDLCSATFTVPIHVAARGFVGEPLAVVVASDLSGDICDERLPVVTVQLSGWEEPPVRAPAD